MEWGPVKCTNPFCLEHDESGCEFLQYMEDISKTNNATLCHFLVKRKGVRAYKNLTNAECFPVELYKSIRLTCLKKLVMTHFIFVHCPNREGKCGITINNWEEKR